MSEVFENKIFTCRDCGCEFVFSVGEQEFFALKFLKNQPTRCPNCRVTIKLLREGGPGGVEVNCDACGAPTVVPFKPTGIRPVFCSLCFQKNRVIEPEKLEENSSRSVNSAH